MVEKAIIFYRKYFRKKRYGWSGDYANWEQASQHCDGYDASDILRKVKDAALKVKNGEAVYERDSVLFDQVMYSYPLLSTLLWVALVNKGNLNVIDFGGSLGSTYFQNRKFLAALNTLQWNIIEQPGFVETGKIHIEDDTISFHNTIEEAQLKSKADLLIISCTIQYLEKPYELLEHLIQFDIPYILIDNTPFNFEHRDRITIQKVPPSIYTASYPCWFLNYADILQVLYKKYNLVTEHFNEDSIELDGRKIRYQGILMELKKMTL